MQIKKIALVFFSPTGTTKRAAAAIAEGAGYPVETHDFTHFVNAVPPEPFDSETLVLIGTPVYVGRIPPCCFPYLHALKGNNTPAILLSVYGNRNFDDCLLELEDLVRAAGFLPVGAAAFVGEHSFSDRLAGGRPDEADLEIARGFGKSLKEKLAAAASVPVLAPGAIPGVHPYRQFKPNSSTISPERNDKCIKCGACAAACPSGAIQKGDYDFIDTSKCLKCRACARACPVNAIDITNPGILAHTESLIKTYGPTRREPELII
jgi:ferredoxin/flavodoxin